jgi:hypothetical protein
MEIFDHQHLISARPGESRQFSPRPKKGDWQSAAAVPFSAVAARNIYSLKQ